MKEQTRVLEPCGTEGLSQVSQIAAGYFSNNQVPILEISKVLHEIAQSLGELESPSERTKRLPVVPIEESVHPDYIVCLETGRKMKMLKRHLKTLGLTPEQYKERWGLPSDYPIVSENYAKHRSGLAVKIGLGKRNKKHA